jgi:hypothetical protein
MRTWFLAVLVVGGGCRQSMRSTAEADKSAVQAWDQLLHQVVDARGLVDYDQLEQNRDALDRYVAWLADDRAWTGKVNRDYHAQYLNAYNAFTLYQVLERGRPDSVRDVQGWAPWPGFLFFHWTQFHADGDWLTLSEIENERLRWKELDYRDHAAMNCASMSCPPLRNELYQPKQLKDQLDDQFQRWMNDEQRGVRIENGEAVLSPLFDWYARDFAFFTAGVNPCTLAASVVTDPAKSKALYDLAEQGCPRKYFDYDWRLNDSKAR